MSFGMWIPLTSILSVNCVEVLALRSIHRWISARNLLGSALFEHWERTMSRGLYPLLLSLAMVLPGQAGAVGLGEIRVASALNEPLSAQIDIVGATTAELGELRAAVASRETFEQYGADRPAFLSSTQFTVSRDPQGRPILAVHSDQPFTDPLVRLLVVLRWGHGEVIREYSLLLDPVGTSDTHRASEMASREAGRP
jgi:Tfp pilus assembly protein FimV